MKIIFIFLTRLIDSIKEYKMLYVGLLTVLIITFVGLNYQYCSKQNMIRKQKEDAETNYTIQVTPDSLSSEQLDELFGQKEFHITNIRLHSLMKSPDVTSSIQSRELEVLAEYKQEDSNDDYGEEINETMIGEKAQVVIVPSIFKLVHKDVSQITIEERIYEIIGENQKNDYSYIIPYTTLLKNFKPSLVEIIVDKKVASEVYQKIQKYIEDSWGIDSNQIELPKVDNFTIDRRNTAMLYTVLVAVLAFLNCSFIYSYFLDKRRKEFTIMRLTGCSKKRAFCYFMLEIFLLSTIAFLLGMIGLFLINRYVFQIVMPVVYIPLYINDMMELYGMVMVVMLFIMSVVTGRFTIHSMREEIMKGEEY